MNSREENAGVGAAMVAVFAGAASFFVCGYLLIMAGLNAGLIKLTFFAPPPKQLPWVVPSIFGGAIFAAVIVAWLVFRFFDKKILPKK